MGRSTAVETAEALEGSESPTEEFQVLPAIADPARLDFLAIRR
jgi:hypothetical protein